MAVASSPARNLLLLFFFFLLSGGSPEAVSFHVANFDSLRPSAVCSAPRAAKRGGLKVSHREGPCSPLGLPRVSNREILLRDRARVNSLQARYAGALQPLRVTETTTMPADVGVSVGTLNYVVSVGLGSPSKNLILVVDTGSDLTWVQCYPCFNGTGCYAQRDPIFNPAESVSYKRVTCKSRDCARLASGTSTPPSCSSSACYYSTRYGDGSATEGFYARETLVLSSNSIPNFRFGCGQKNKGLFGTAAGLLALGPGQVSLVSQTAKKYGKLFSYCLPSSSSDTGFLTFGSGAGATAGMKFTPLLKVPVAPSFYFVEMVGILVEGKLLDIPPSTFSSPGTIIDSGTIVTRLPPAAYSALRSAFRQALANYTLVQPFQIFDTCYDFRQNDNVLIPTIALRFGGGVDVEMGLTGIVFFASESQVCLAFAPNQDRSQLGIIGNRQQRTFEVVYDVGRSRIGFAAGGCN